MYNNNEKKKNFSVTIQKIKRMKTVLLIVFFVLTLTSGIGKNKGKF